MAVNSPTSMFWVQRDFIIAFHWLNMFCWEFTKFSLFLHFQLFVYFSQFIIYFYSKIVKFSIHLGKFDSNWHWTKVICRTAAWRMHAVKNILEYAQIARSGPKSMILDIEGHSITWRDTFFTSSIVDMNCTTVHKPLAIT